MSPDITYYTFDSPSTTVSLHYNPSTTSESHTPLKRGDRVRIREGYEDAGEVYFYIGLSSTKDGMASVGYPINGGYNRILNDNYVLAAAIEPYPYSREERIERAISDFEDASGVRLTTDEYVVLFAILEAGV